MSPSKSRTPRSPQSRGGRRRRLRSIENVRAFVAHVLRELEEHSKPGEINAARAKLYGSQILGGLIEKSDLTRRVEELEAALKKGGTT